MNRQFRDLRSAILLAALAALHLGAGASSLGAVPVDPLADSTAEWSQWTAPADLLPSLRVGGPTLSGGVGPSHGLPRAADEPSVGFVGPLVVPRGRPRPLPLPHLAPLALGHPATAPPERA